MDPVSSRVHPYLVRLHVRYDGDWAIKFHHILSCGSRGSRYTPLHSMSWHGVGKKKNDCFLACRVSQSVGARFWMHKLNLPAKRSVGKGSKKLEVRDHDLLIQMD